MKQLSTTQQQKSKFLYYLLHDCIAGNQANTHGYDKQSGLALHDPEAILHALALLASDAIHLGSTEVRRQKLLSTFDGAFLDHLHAADKRRRPSEPV